MPLTNDEFVLGTHSRGLLGAKCPFPKGSMQAWSWWKGQRSALPLLLDKEAQRLITDGPVESCKPNATPFQNKEKQANEHQDH